MFHMISYAGFLPSTVYLFGKMLTLEISPNKNTLLPETTPDCHIGSLQRGSCDLQNLDAPLWPCYPKGP